MGDVPPDPAIRWGRLENGLRYAVRHNAEPAGRVYLVLQVAVGSVDERDDQRGYAHFVEHMMFRGTRKFPATSVVNLLQHEGLEMGADTSAFTNYTSTFYNLDLPRNTPDKIALGLSILRDFADGAVMEPAAIKREAKVIESERRTRESSFTPVADALNSFLYPGSLIATRTPIGTPESVLGATADRLRGFYHQWYRPERMTVIAVGDASPDDLEHAIREQFASLTPAPGPAPVEPDLGFRVPAEKLEARFLPTPIPDGTSAVLYSLAAIGTDADTLARRRTQVAQSAGFSMFNARLDELARQQARDFGAAQAGLQYEFGKMRQAFVRVDGRPDLWRAALRIGEQQLRRVLQQGFTPDEVRVQIKAYQGGLHEAVRTESSRQSAFLAQSIRSGLETNLTPTSPDFDLETLGPVVDQLTPDQCNEAFRKIWNDGARRLAVIGHYSPPLTDQDLLTAYEESTVGQFFSQKDEHAILPFDYTNFGPAGTVAKRVHDERLDIHSLEFANKVRLNLKRTDFEKGRVYLRLRIGQGMVSEPFGQPGTGLIAGNCLIAGGLGRYDNTELVRRLAGDALSFGFTVEEDGFYFNGYASPDKLEELLQIVCAFITDPAFRTEGYQSCFAQLQSYYASTPRDPTQLLRALCPGMMAGGNVRYSLVPWPQLVQRQSKQVEEWLKAAFASDSIELGLVGDMDVESTVLSVGRTLGSLPPRQAEPKPDPLRRPSIPAKAIQQTWPTTGTETGKAAVRIYWPGVDDADYHTNRKLHILCDILVDRLRVKIREELGATYSPQKLLWGSLVWPGFGYFAVEVETSPAMVGKVATIIRRTATDLAAGKITQDEFERAIAPVEASLEKDLRENNYWTDLLSRIQKSPDCLNWPLTRNQDYRGMTRQDVEDVARRFLGTPRVFTFIARPK
jgi:zinc protease